MTVLETVLNSPVVEWMDRHRFRLGIEQVLSIENKSEKSSPVATARHSREG